MLAPSLNAIPAETLQACSRAGMLAPDGRCKTMDAAADGYVRAEAVGSLMLRPAPPGGYHFPGCCALL
eukprot:1154291-Pelagomonas_calceolata.AAC.1